MEKIVFAVCLLFTIFTHTSASTEDCSHFEGHYVGINEDGKRLTLGFYISGNRMVISGIENVGGVLFLDETATGRNNPKYSSFCKESNIYIIKNFEAPENLKEERIGHTRMETFVKNSDGSILVITETMGDDASRTSRTLHLIPE